MCQVLHPLILPEMLKHPGQFADFIDAGTYYFHWPVVVVYACTKDSVDRHVIDRTPDHINWICVASDTADI